MKLPYKMENKNLNFSKLKTYSNLLNNANKNKSRATTNSLTKEPLSTRDAVKFLIDGTLRLRVCRYCLNVTQELSELDEILEVGIAGAIHEVTIKDMIASFHPVKVADDPNYPNKICQECLNHALKTYLFLQQCEQAERALHNYFEDIHEKYSQLDPLEPVKKRGKRKLNPNPNIIRVEHKNVIDYALPIINLINTSSIPLDSSQMSDLECKKCWQVLPSVESLVNHEKSHPKSMWFHCRLCGKSFAKRHHLKRHLRDENIQSKEFTLQVKEIKCNTCGITSENLGRHLLHIEKHKFKVLLEHLVEKKMDKLCTVCLEESSNMVQLEEVIYLHGGYPGLTGDKTIYDIVSQTFPNMSPDTFNGTKICNTCLNHTITSYVFCNKVQFVHRRLETCISVMLEKLKKFDCSGTVLVEVSQNLILPMFKYDSLETIIEDANFDESKLSVEVLEDEFRDPKLDLESEESDTENPAKNAIRTYSKKQVNGLQKPDNNMNICSEFLTFKKKIKPKRKLKYVYTCPFCNKHFVSDYFLKKHIVKHVSVQVQCKTCFKYYPTKFHLFEHVKMVHVLKKSNSVSCETCGRKFMSVKKLRIHKLCHRFKECHLCGKLFDIQRHFDAHMQRHGVQFYMMKKYDQHTCSFCTKACSNENELSLHVNKTHLQIKPYSCDMCEKQYYTEFNLSSHKKLHRLISKEVCTFCKKTLKCRKDLVVHVRKHIGIKPHQCPVCRQTFYSDTKMKKHMKMLHGGIFWCRLCKAVVQSYRSLKAHISVVHSSM